MAVVNTRGKIRVQRESARPRWAHLAPAAPVQAADASAHSPPEAMTDDVMVVSSKPAGRVIFIDHTGRARGARRPLSTTPGRAGTASLDRAGGVRALPGPLRLASARWVPPAASSAGSNRKPFAMVDGQRADVGFNVSHSGRHGLIAIAQRDGIGIDVEERVAQRDLEGIGSLVYGPVERRLLASATGRERVHLFYRLWSMKEALIKALGTGFSLSPREFEIPGPMLQAAKSGEFRFPHAPSDAWRLLDLGGSRFAAALACRLPSSSRSNPAPGGE